MDAEKAVAERYQTLRGVMDERVTRCQASAEALGRGGVTAVARATGLSRMTVRAERDEVSRKKHQERWCEFGARELAARRWKWPSRA
jgi:hypothetical protein